VSQGLGLGLGCQDLGLENKGLDNITGKNINELFS